VVLAHVERGGQLVPSTAAHDRETTEDWQDLVNSGTLGVWLVEGSMLTQARDLVFAHLAGFAPIGVTRLYRRS